MRCFEDLKPGRCKFPTGDRAPYLFCAKAAKPGSVYCAHHHKLCHSGRLGKSYEGLAGMIDATEQTVIVRSRIPAEAHMPLDEAIRVGEAV